MYSKEERAKKKKKKRKSKQVRAIFHAKIVYIYIFI